MNDYKFVADTTKEVLVPLFMQADMTTSPIQMLAQSAITLMFTIDTDLLRTEGGGLYEQLKSANGYQNEKEITNLTNIAIRKVEGIIKADQLDKDIPADGQLSSIRLDSVTLPDRESAELILVVTSVSGATLATTLTV